MCNVYLLHVRIILLLLLYTRVRTYARGRARSPAAVLLFSLFIIIVMKINHGRRNILRKKINKIYDGDDDADAAPVIDLRERGDRPSRGGPKRRRCSRGGTSRGGGDRSRACTWKGEG